MVVAYSWSNLYEVNCNNRSLFYYNTLRIVSEEFGLEAMKVAEQQLSFKKNNTHE
jgi:hypothetical protein